jgi:hypothetical protein
MPSGAILASGQEGQDCVEKSLRGLKLRHMGEAVENGQLGVRQAGDHYIRHGGRRCFIEFTHYSQHRGSHVGQLGAQIERCQRFACRNDHRGVGNRLQPFGGDGGGHGAECLPARFGECCTCVGENETVGEAGVAGHRLKRHESAVAVAEQADRPAGEEIPDRRRDAIGHRGQAARHRRRCAKTGQRGQTTLNSRDKGPTTREKPDRSASWECSSTKSGPSPESWDSIKVVINKSVTTVSLYGVYLQATNCAMMNRWLHSIRGFLVVEGPNDATAGSCLPVASGRDPEL